MANMTSNENALYLQLASANGGPNSSPRTENVITKKENKQ